MPQNPFSEAFRKALIPTHEINRGDTFSVEDDPDNPIIKFPEDALPPDHPKAKKRTFHKQRYVLVIQDKAISGLSKVVSVLIVPLSHSGTDTEVTIVIPDEFTDLPDESVAFLHLTHPILQVFLKEKVGHISTDSSTYKRVMGIFYRILGEI